MQKQTVSGYIGLISAYDYSMAAKDSRNWLKYPYQWTLTQSASYAYSAYGTDYGNLSDFYRTTYGYEVLYDGLAVRPVVYLDSSVYVISGDGTEKTPYRLYMAS